MTPYASTLGLIAARHQRRPACSTPALDALFQRLCGCSSEADALVVEERIWHLWMHHPHRFASEALDRSADDIAARRFDVAETRLTRLLRHRPDYVEAWHKRATLYYLRGDDAQCVQDLERTLQQEPRHFGALCSFGEILLGEGNREGACFAFSAALSVHPFLARARAIVRSHRR
ncbi:MAG TPA: hypothetical protein VLA41_05760 [Burkholderiales bacterium]|nr:hypothetical protein [Burkholderiales bacterium]